MNFTWKRKENSIMWRTVLGGNDSFLYMQASTSLGEMFLLKRVIV
jgi:hypothetical protein